MTDEELNKWLHENVMDECFHEVRLLPSEKRGLEEHPYICLNCKYRFIGSASSGPNYCQSLDAVSRVEAKVIEKLGEINGVNKLHFHLSKIMPKSDFYTMVASAAFATARQRSEACRLAWLQFMEAHK